MGTVLSRLIVSTQDYREEVRNLINSAAHFNIDLIITVQDINAILNIEADRSIIGWHKGRLLWKPHANQHRDYDMQLWQDIAIADASQKLRLIHSQPKSTLVLEAARQRRFWAVKALLEMGLDPGAPSARWNVFRSNITALDLVSWTENVSTKNCSDSGLLLQKRDKEIVELLLSHHATRGIEYRLEYQFLIGLYQVVLAPIAVTAALCFILYFDGPWFWMLNLRTKELMDKIIDEGKHSSLWMGAIFIPDRVLTLVWSILTTGIAIVCFTDKTMIPFLVFLGVVGAIPTIWKVYLATNGEEDMRLLILNNFLFDVATYFLIFPVLGYGFLVLWMMGNGDSTRLGYLAAKLHGNAHPLVVWDALYSPLGGEISRGTKSLSHTWLFLVRRLKNALCKLAMTIYQSY